MDQLLFGCECIDSSSKEAVMRPIAETRDEPRMEPMECNALVVACGSRPARCTGRGSTRGRLPFVEEECRLSARFAVRRTAQYGRAVPAKVAPSIEYLGGCQC